MSNFEEAIQVVLRHEGGFIHDPLTGEVANRGITQAFLKLIHAPDTSEEFIRNMTQEQATELYRIWFWDFYHLGLVEDQRLASKLLDLTVNIGGDDTIPTLQQALNSLGAGLKVDGLLGPKTALACTKYPVEHILAEFKWRMEARYRAKVDANPKLAGKLGGWLTRLDAEC